MVHEHAQSGCRSKELTMQMPAVLEFQIFFLTRKHCSRCEEGNSIMDLKFLTCPNDELSKKPFSVRFLENIMEKNNIWYRVLRNFSVHSIWLNICFFLIHFVNFIG
jgi:hypothetical protein